MRISVFGMGYVGAVCSACFAKDGHQIIGVDPQQVKVDLINQGKSPIIEEGLEELISAGVSSGNLKAVQNVDEAIEGSDISIICVGTPSRINGSLNLDYIKLVCEEIGAAIKNKQGRHTIVMRSTVLPGTAQELAIPALEQSSGKKMGEGFGYVSNPEFLRESTAIFDFYHPPKTVIGETDTESGEIIASLYSNLEAPLIRTDVAIAEMVKYADNAWHAVKVSFGNEIGNIAKKLDIDGQKVMDIFCKDQKLNLSAYYLRPGFAFGGSCLPKDVRAITYKARDLDIHTPLLSSLIPSNNEQIDQAFSLLKQTQKKKIAMLGISFKANTDDLRESPLVELVEKMIGKGYDIKIYDKCVSIAKLVGANKEYIMQHIPHVSDLLDENLEHVINHADVIVIGNNAEEFQNIGSVIKDGTHIIDLVRIKNLEDKPLYQGICW
ncbi:MAG: nucleotide sugar dehydrogenase [Methylococcaceae bacterium]|nr:nucleotide sugar dehydrogenase [Methylococcaceae bacterium]